MKIQKSDVRSQISARFTQPLPRTRPPRQASGILLCLLALVLAASLNAAPGNVWHIPAAGQDGIPSTMRDPASPEGSQLTTFYQGVWKGDGANQTGGLLVYRSNGGGWQSEALAFHSNVNEFTVNHNQFWKASTTMPANTGDSFEYYFIVYFDNRDTTYLFGDNSISSVEADAQANPTSLAVSYPPPSFTVNGVNGNYSKSNFYIDENNDTVFPVLELRLNPNIGTLDSVQVFTNLNNRERANEDYNNDGIEDGIIPLDGNTITTADTGAYFQAYEMSDSNADGTYELDMTVLETGAYRITGRYRVNPSDPWIWLGDSGIRDHAVVVAPKAARDMRIYELHVSNANATGPTFAERGTFEDLYEAGEHVNIDWLNNLGVNWIWFQPFHPQGLDGRQIDPATGSAYDPGSPYSIRNFWEINPLYTRSYDGNLSNPVANPTNYAAAMTAFQNFAAAADTGGVQLMLDFPFNHTAPDVVLGQQGVDIFAPDGNPGGWTAGDLIRDRVPGFFSTDGGEGSAAYSSPAGSVSNIATAPDRNDFGKWSDVRDVFFGRYATLVTGYPTAETSRAIVRDEGDWMDYSSMGPDTIGVWRYFGEVLPYWIVQSGHRGSNSTPSDGSSRDALDTAGIDGLRKDFGQGLPPQAMEYIINRTHEVKWNFVFMSESLDGEQVTYRSSRHFAVLNENIVFPLQAATETSGYRGIFEGRRSAYGQSLVLLNNTSHDEVPYADSWEALIRYATVSTNDGAPMIMYGQEIGAGQKFQESLPQGAFDWYELNFGKNIPHFKKWNSMEPQWNAWRNNNDGVQYLYPVYAGIGQARAFSPALRSSNRWFLNPVASNDPDPDIFAVAKYTQANSPVASQDVVLAFTNLDRDNSQANTFGMPPALADLLGLQSGRTYNVKNIAAYLGRDNELTGRRDTWLWGSGRTRDDIVTSGVYVDLKPVPTTDAAWNTDPYEAQFLKVYDITAPADVPDSIEQENFHAYAIGTQTTFDWEDVAPDSGGVTPHYEVEVFVNGVSSGTVTTVDSQYTVNANEGESISIAVRTINPDFPSNKSSAVSPPSPSIQLLSATGDADGDTISNGQEDLYGTDPLDATSQFRFNAIEFTVDDNFHFTWDAAPGRTYNIETSSTMAEGSWNTIASGLTEGSYTHDSPPSGRLFFRVVPVKL